MICKWMSKLASKITVMYCGQDRGNRPYLKELLVTPIILIHKLLSALFLILLTLLPHKSRLNTLPGAIPF